MKLGERKRSGEDVNKERETTRKEEWRGEGTELAGKQKGMRKKEKKERGIKG